MYLVLRSNLLDNASLRYNHSSSAESSSHKSDLNMNLLDPFYVYSTIAFTFLVLLLILSSFCDADTQKSQLERLECSEVWQICRTWLLSSANNIILLTNLIPYIACSHAYQTTIFYEMKSIIALVFIFRLVNPVHIFFFFFFFFTLNFSINKCSGGSDANYPTKVRIRFQLDKHL